MKNIVVQSLSYIFVMMIAYYLKRIEYLQKEDSKVLSKISVSLTLPAAIIGSFVNLELKQEFIFVVFLGFFVNVFMLFCTVVFTRKKEKKYRILLAFNNSSFNLGSFALPYIQAYYPETLVLYVLMFDIGNAIYSMGVNNALISSVFKRNKRQKFDIKEFFKRIFQSIPFITYISMILVSILKIPIPTFFYKVAKIIGNANIIIVMIMFGLMLEIPNNKLKVLTAFKILLIRYFTVLLLGVFLWVFVPLETKVLMVLIISIMSPMSSIIPSFCMEHNLDSSVYGLTSSISVILSVIFLTLEIFFFS